MFVRHFMSAEVFTLSPEQKCFEALHALLGRRLRRAPVMSGDALLGMVTIHDLYRVLPGTVSQAETSAGTHARDLEVRAVMGSPVKTLEPSDHLEAAAQLMLANRIGGAPVMRDQRLVGIITESDIFRALWQVLSQGRGWRVILETPARAGEAPPDYLRLLLEHHCQLRSFLRFDKPEGGEVIHLRAEGPELDDLLRDLRAKAATILSIEGR